MSKLYDILLLINNSERVSQRFLSEESGISLGSVNAIVKNLEEQNYILKTNQKRGYELTSQGLSVLEKYIAENQEDRIYLENFDDEQTVKQAVILAAGEKEIFKKPVSFLSMGEERIIDRIIRILDDAGIDEIIVVAGYEKEYFYNLAKTNPKIKVVENNRYKYTGTMASLACCKDYINDDFILLENDMIFEERAIFNLLEDKNRTSMIITSESGSGDEALVELRNGMVYKMSKDIHQLNKIDGEMIGITKVSKDFYDKMLEEYQYNRNPYVNYEYIIMDIAREYKLGYIKIDDLMWFEIDSEKHLSIARGHIYSSILRREDEIRTENIKSELINGLGINCEDILSIEAVGGMTNNNYKVNINGEYYILRMPGVGTSDMISRADEKNNARIGAILGLDTEIVYFNEYTGVKVSRFIENAETLNPQTASYEENMEIVAALLKKLHFSCLDFENEFNVFREIEKYERLVKEANGKYYDAEYPDVRARVMALEEELSRIGKDCYTCHNDTVPENFVKGDNNKTYLIDWEYSGMNDPMWDIAGHILECNFNKDEEELFKSKYFSIENPFRKASKKGNEIEEEKILLFKICQDFLWTIWTVLKEAKGVSFGEYGPMRYKRAKENLDLFYDKYMQ